MISYELYQMPLDRFLRAVLFVALLVCMTVPMPAEETALELADDTVRPFDRIVLKNGSTILGTIETPGDFRSLAELVVLASSGGTRLKLRQAEIESVLPRQSAEQVYRLRQRRVEAISSTRERARQELELGLWCKTPLPVLDGKAPRPRQAFDHLLQAVDLDPTLAAAYPHLIDLLHESDGATLTPSSFDRDAHLHFLATQAGRKEPELDFRLGVFLAEQADQPSHARVFLERFLGSDHRNQSQRRRARRILKDIYVRAGAMEKAVALYEQALVEPESNPANFEAHLELGKLQARHLGLEGQRLARERFARALAIEPNHAEILAELAALDHRSGALAAAEKTLRAILAREPENTAVSVSLGLVLAGAGKLAAAELILRGLETAADAVDRARALYGLGQIAESRGQDLVALTHYRDAALLDPGLLEARVAQGMALLRAGNSEDARLLAEQLNQASAESPAVFAATSRLLGEVMLAEGKADAALTHLLRAAEVSSDDATLLERVGILFMRLGNLDKGFTYLLRARQAGGDRPDTLNAMAFFHYSRGDHAAAKKIFTTVLSLVKAPPKPTARDAKPAMMPPARLYALRGQELIDDLGRLEMWTAEVSTAEVSSLNGWQEVERFGIDISGKEGGISFRGTQSGVADGVTMALLDRPVDVATFDRVQVSARIESGKARVGLRLEAATKSGSTIGIIFYRDFSGTLKAQVKGSTGDWEAVPRTEEASPDGGKLINPELAVWPEGNSLHVLEIRRSQRPQAGAALAGSRGLGTFDLYFDGEPVIWNVKVTGIGGKTYDVGISGQTEALGNQYSLWFEGFKVYRERPRKRDKKEF